jgi:hypothetical protein
LIKKRISILQDIEALGEYADKILKVFGKAVTDFVEEQSMVVNAYCKCGDTEAVWDCK